MGGTVEEKGGGRHGVSGEEGMKGMGYIIIGSFLECIALCPALSVTLSFCGREEEDGSHEQPKSHHVCHPQAHPGHLGHCADHPGHHPGHDIHGAVPSHGCHHLQGADSPHTQRGRVRTEPGAGWPPSDNAGEKTVGEVCSFLSSLHVR